MELLSILKYVLNNEYSAFFFTPPIINDSKSYFFKNVNSSIICKNPNEIMSSLDEIDKKINESFEGYGAISYEAGYVFEKRLEKILEATSDDELLSFHFFDEGNRVIINSCEIGFSEIEKYVEHNFVEVCDLILNTSREKYISDVNRILKYIEAGDTYQVNYTASGSFDINGDLISLFYKLIYNQSASYTAIMNFKDRIIISISPELFFELNGNEIKAKPMKGTMRRGSSPDLDKKIALELKNDEKNRAENIMIVDLLRNDLGRICEYDSVRAESICDLEKYETLYQMTSTVTGQLNVKSLKEILENIYPCGSITGAPKIRTMEIINELETNKRGYYTGTIGLFTREQTTFNVPIRTLVIDKETKQGTLGIGSGIVWDSDPEEEFDEVILKSDFLMKPREQFSLFETMLIEGGEIFLEEYHVLRLKESADYFRFNFDIEKYKNCIAELLNELEIEKKYRVKLLLNKWGEFKIEHAEFTPSKGKVTLELSEQRVNSENSFQYFKTTNRKLYDKERANISPDTDEIIFMNERGEIAEGTITNIFMKLNEKWLTPPVSSGILNGCYREMLLDCKVDHIESVLTYDDLLTCTSIKCVNSLRGELNVGKIVFKGKVLREFI